MPTAQNDDTIRVRAIRPDVDPPVPPPPRRGPRRLGMGLAAGAVAVPLAGFGGAAFLLRPPPPAPATLPAPRAEFAIRAAIEAESQHRSASGDLPLHPQPAHIGAGFP
ncbi:MAG TPA: hypothetical protein VGH36_04720 [Acetobacteraceae bacterium]